MMYKEVFLMQKNKLFIVIPCYNEEEVLQETTNRLRIKINQMIKNNLISKDSKVMYVNDGSKDNTWEMIKSISEKDNLFTGISLSKNRGHQNALVAGLLTSKKYADIVISMDADLQDDIDVMDKMIIKYNEGCQIVYGVREARKTDTFFKKNTAESFYKLMSRMGVDIVYNHADYRLVSKKVLNEFERYEEVNLFLRGIFPLIGFKSDIVYYNRSERFAGKSKYSLKKMINFAWDGITSFSIKPISLILSFGALLTVFSFISILFFLISNSERNNVIMIVSIISLFSGINILCIGIVGEYIGKIYFETKRRPRFIIEENLLKTK